MAFSSLGERLALIIDGNAAGGVKAVKQVGDASQREFTRAETSRQKWSTGLIAGGSAAIGVAAVVAKGLGSTVKAYEESQAASTRLDATMAKMPQLAHANRGALDALAQSTVDKTRVDDEAVTTTESMLGQFGLTEQQILRLTPLIVDYSVKTGVDMVTATKAVEKGLLGQGRQLTANGVVLDKTKLKTDAYGTVVTALGKTVGGFAQRDGKTFEGQLKIIDNQLQNFKEGVGQGVVGELKSMTVSVAGLAGGLGHLSNSSEQNIGRLATIGTVTTAAVGGVAVLGGAVLKLKDAFIVSGEAEGIFGTSLTGLGFAGVAAGAAVAALGLYAYGKAANATKVDVDSLARANDHELVAAWEAGRVEFTKFMGAVGAKKEDLKLFQMLAEQNVGTAARLRDGLAKAGYSVAGYDKILRAAAKGQAQANTDQQAGADIVQRYGQNVGVAAAKVKTITQEVNDYRDAVDRATSTTLDADDAERHLHDALRNQVTAVLDLHDKQVTLDKVRKDSKSTAEDITRAELDVYAALDNVGQVTDDAKRAVLDLGVKQAGASSTADAVSKHTTAYVGALQNVAATLAPNSPLRIWLQQYIDSLHSVPSTVTTHFDTTGGNAGGTHAGGGTRHFAAGGDPPVGEAVTVGEAGSETVVFDRPAHVFPHGTRVAAMSPPVEEHTHFHLHVSPTFGANAAQFARELGDLIARDARAGGAITLGIRKAVKAA